MRAEVKLTWYQKFFNPRWGFREDLDRSFSWYINEYVKQYLFWKFIFIGKEKDYKSWEYRLFGYRTWIGFSIKFVKHTAVYPHYRLSIIYNRLGWDLGIDFGINNGKSIS